MTSHRRLAKVLQSRFLVVAVVLIGACSTAPGAEQGLMPGLQERQDAAARAYVYENLGELLGNHLYQVGDAPATPLTAAVVTGRFLSVQEGRAFTVEGSLPGAVGVVDL